MNELNDVVVKFTHAPTGHGMVPSNVRTYHTRFRFQDCYSHCDGRPLGKLCSNEIVYGEPEIEAIMNIPGVVNVAVYDSDNLYDLHVKKATAFEWEEIHPEIMYTLNRRHERLSK